jgi:putative addiction module component (TIGR02574 family)
LIGLEAMSKTIANLLADARELSVDDKEILIHELLVQLDETPQDEIERLQLELITRRHRDIVEGRVKGIPSEESDRRIRAKLDEKK